MKRARVVIDTLFLLPILGIEVEEINKEDIILLKNLSDKILFIYPAPMLIELLGKALRKAKENNLKFLPEEAAKGLRLILSNIFVKVKIPDTRSLLLASQIWLKGHKDILDNIAYAYSRTLNSLLLTLDENLTNFLKKNNYPTNNIVNINELIKSLKKISR